MTSSEIQRVTVLGTGLIGTSVALAASRVGIDVTGWDPDARTLMRAAATGALAAADGRAQAIAAAQLVVVCAPIAEVAPVVADALRDAPEAVVTDVASVKGAIVGAVSERVGAIRGGMARFVPGHPMGGSERSGPEHASASVLDGIVWAVAATPGTDPAAAELVERFVAAVGARPIRMTPERHDRLVAFVSHLPQVASTALMGLAATEEADEPDILLLAAGGFRDLTRLAASNPALWGEILGANQERIAEAIDRFVVRLQRLRTEITEGRTEDVVRSFDEAKRARLRLAAKPTVRAGVGVLQMEIPDRPGALARLAAALGEGGVNIEDLQIVHSPEGGRGTVHVTIAGSEAVTAADVLRGEGFDPVRLA
jgi:prephenate dehydrogenase